MIRRSEMMRKKAERIRETVSRSVGMIGPPCRPRCWRGRLISIQQRPADTTTQTFSTHGIWLLSRRRAGGERGGWRGEYPLDIDTAHQKIKSEHNQNNCTNLFHFLLLSTNLTTKHRHKIIKILLFVFYNS